MKKALNCIILGLTCSIFANCSHKKEPHNVIIQMERVLISPQFHVKINSYTIEPSIGYGYSHETRAGEGNSFLILNVTYTNCSQKTVDLPGEIPFQILAKVDTALLTYDMDENINLDWVGIKYSFVNPGVSFTATLVYKIPENLRAALYFYACYYDGTIYSIHLKDGQSHWP